MFDGQCSPAAANPKQLPSVQRGANVDLFPRPFRDYRIIRRTENAVPSPRYGSRVLVRWLPVPAFCFFAPDGN